tara:strand:+ start:200 stop:400 length:201 start_codon:yes stop_codon:yes gene_type:complete
MTETTKVDCVSLEMKTLSIPMKMDIPKDFVMQIVIIDGEAIVRMVGTTAGIVTTGDTALGIGLDCM